MREKAAINAYLKLLQAKGASSSVLYKRSLFLDKLNLALADKVLDGNEYREVIELVMDTIPADDWHENLTAAREFYPFWLENIKAIAVINLNPGFEVKPTAWRPEQVALKDLWSSLDSERFDTSESWPLKAYAQALRFEGADMALVETRTKLAKIILIRLRGAPEQNNKSYRTAVDLTLPLFNIKHNRSLFLVVVREFYYFWTGNPDAVNMVLKDDKGNLLHHFLVDNPSLR
ncbi:hypothetical protein GALL_169580 [mine drainage metagenome]|uniref:Uncharacterized protein n=1 Tax=mine drainage metagenome TaxID=410659 RepID=A0A1J5RYR6_9ZZZZ